MSSSLLISWRKIAIIFLLSHDAIVDCARTSKCVNEENVCSGSGPTYRPLPGCNVYATCSSRGDVVRFNTCSINTVFDVLLQYCNHEYISKYNCRIKSCEPTASPSESPTPEPTHRPTRHPSKMPTPLPTAPPTEHPTRHPTPAPSHDFFQLLEIQPVRKAIEDTVFRDSSMYTFEGFMTSLREMATVGIHYNDEVFSFFVGNNINEDVVYGRTNVAAFLANVMVESISFDTCDEINTDTGGIFTQGRKYALSNSCGQYGRSYQDEVCSNINEIHMSCDVDATMDISSSRPSNFEQNREPPPLTCGPRRFSGDIAGYWDSQSGKTVEAAFSNAVGRLDTEGCCWWGRGVLGTRGVCNIGKLNYYLGKRARDERGEARFPDIDFCANPGAICESNTEEIRWVTGMFEWVERIQSHGDSGITTSSYRSKKWNYLSNLKEFVNGGMHDDSFIDAVSSIIARGCPDLECSNLQIPMLQERRSNFYKILDILRITDAPTYGPTSRAPDTPQLAPPILGSPTAFTNDHSNNFYSSPPVQVIPVAPTLVESDLTSKPTKVRKPKKIIPLESSSAPKTGAKIYGDSSDFPRFGFWIATLFLFVF